MQRGSLIIYDNNGKIWVNTGDAEGDVLPHEIPEGLPYILTEFGELDNKIIKGVDVEKKQLILEDAPIIESREGALNRQLLQTQNAFIDLKYKELLDKNLGGK